MFSEAFNAIVELPPKVGDFVVYESLAMMSYLDRKYPTPPLFGTSAEETALINIGAERDGVDAEGVIQLSDTAPERLAVVADALAKSAALAQQEARIAEALDRMEPAVASLRLAGRRSEERRVGKEC